MVKRGFVCRASVQNVKQRSQLLTYFNANVYSTFYEFYIVGLRVTKLGRKIFPQ